MKYSYNDLVQLNEKLAAGVDPAASTLKRYRLVEPEKPNSFLGWLWPKRERWEEVDENDPEFKAIEEEFEEEERFNKMMMRNLLEQARADKSLTPSQRRQINRDIRAQFAPPEINLVPEQLGNYILSQRANRPR